MHFVTFVALVTSVTFPSDLLGAPSDFPGPPHMPPPGHADAYAQELALCILLLVFPRHCFIALFLFP